MTLNRPMEKKKRLLNVTDRPPLAPRPATLFLRANLVARHPGWGLSAQTAQGRDR